MKTVYNNFMMWFYRTFLRDRCEICAGSQGGIRGNENRVDGVLMCDYCSAWHRRHPRFWEVRP